jgi:Ca2+-binding RTX toxin-like protein
VNADAGTTYLIQVTALAETGGPLQLSWGPLIFGTNGADTLVGTSVAQEIRGRAGNDFVLGHGGADTLIGGRGNDTMRGGTGFDLLFDHRGSDSLAGDGGRDTIDVRDGRSNDDINGGAGIDTCRRDPGDRRGSCER